MDKVLVRAHGDDTYQGSIWWEDGRLVASDPSLNSIARSFQRNHGDEALLALALFDNGYWYGENAVEKHLPGQHNQSTHGRKRWRGKGPDPRERSTGGGSLNDRLAAFKDWWAALPDRDETFHKHIDPNFGGAMNEGIARFEHDGHQYLVKKDGNSVILREHVGGQVAQAMGLPFSALSLDMRHVVMPFIEGETAGETELIPEFTYEVKVPWEEWLTDVYNPFLRDMPNTFMMSVLDYAAINTDRHKYNWMVTPEGAAVPIDHGILDIGWYGYGDETVEGVFYKVAKKEGSASYAWFGDFDAKTAAAARVQEVREARDRVAALTSISDYDRTQIVARLDRLIEWMEEWK